jgi:Ni/Fe-hydrogenase subunit HybB-like protein
MDWWLVSSLLLIMLLGFVNLWSASSAAGYPFQWKQCQWYAAGSILMFATLVFDYRKLASYWIHIYVLTLLMLILVSVATWWKMVSYYVGGPETGRVAATALLSGPLASNFWIFEVGIGLAAPILLLAFTRVRSLGAMSLAGLLTLVGMFIARMDMVIAGQIVPVWDGFDSNLTMYTNYMPSGYEWIVAFGGIGLTGVAFLLGERFFGKAFADHGEH